MGVDLPEALEDGDLSGVCQHLNVAESYPSALERYSLDRDGHQAERCLPQTAQQIDLPAALEVDDLHIPHRCY